MPTNEELLRELNERLERQEQRDRELREELRRLHHKDREPERLTQGAARQRISRGFEHERREGEGGGDDD